MADIKQAHAFLRVVHRDLTALHGMRDVSVFADEIFGFHVQQAIEKCLKAWLCACGTAFPFTHDLNRLLVLVRDTGANVDGLWWTDEFTIFAQQARYEDSHLQADAPLDRSNLLQRVDSLAWLVNGVIQAFDQNDQP